MEPEIMRLDVMPEPKIHRITRRKFIDDLYRGNDSLPTFEIPKRLKDKS